MSKSLLLLAGVLASSLLVGCETEVITHIKLQNGLEDYSSNPDAKRVTRLSKYLEKVEKDPKDAQGWFELGDYYETSDLDLYKALNAYQTGNNLLEPGRYTGGEYLLARVYLRLQQWDRSIAHLNEVFKLEPRDPKAACLNPHFREAHYLRGAIYFLNKQYRPAKREFMRFVEIGGDENRVEEWMDEIQASGE